MEVDAYIGEIVAALDAAGVLDNTFVFVTSDNGPQLDSWPDSGYTPFRGAKGSAWEGGVRVPGIAYWRGMIAPGRQSDELFDLMDLFNTSLASRRSGGQDPDRPLRRRHRPDLVPARRRRAARTARRSSSGTRPT